MGHPNSPCAPRSGKASRGARGVPAQGLCFWAGGQTGSSPAPWILGGSGGDPLPGEGPPPGSLGWAGGWLFTGGTFSKLLPAALRSPPPSMHPCDPSLLSPSLGATPDKAQTPTGPSLLGMAITGQCPILWACYPGGCRFGYRAWISVPGFWGAAFIPPPSSPPSSSSPIAVNISTTWKRKEKKKHKKDKKKEKETKTNKEEN